MLLSALLLASAVHAAPPPSGSRGRVMVHASKEEAMAASRREAACRASGLQLAKQPPPSLPSKVQSLGAQPPANHTLTVLRTIDGCPASSTIRYNVDRPAGRR